MQIEYVTLHKIVLSVRFLISLAAVPFIASCAISENGNASVEVRPEVDQVVCAQDVRQCSDGRFVGRSGPRCEFKCDLVDRRDDQHDCEIQLNRWITQYEPIANGARSNVRGNARFLAVELAKVRYQCANSPLKEGEVYRAPAELSNLASDPEIVKQAITDIKAGKK